MCRAAAIGARVGRIEAVDIGQQHQHVGAGHLRDAGGKPVVVAEADLGGGDRVVLVDHRHRAEREQLREGGARVQVAAPLFGVVRGQEDLRDGDAVSRQCLLIGVRQANLSGGGGRLLFLEPQRAPAQPEMAAPDRDRPGGDDDQLLAAPAAACDIVDQRIEPVATDLAVIRDQQCRADLQHEAACRNQRRGRGGVVASRRRGRRARYRASFETRPSGPLLRMRKICL